MRESNQHAIATLLAAPEPSLHWKVRALVMAEEPSSLAELRERIRRSPRVQTLLAGVTPGSVYKKWQGAHWVLEALADLGYPPGRSELIPLKDRVLKTWLGPDYYQEFPATTKASTYRGTGVPVLEGRYRRCGSQQGNALRSLVLLGLADDGAHRLAERLLHWQWPDGGWNCDRNPGADTSSFMETLLPLRGLAAYAEWSGNATAREAAERAAEVFLERQLFRRRSDGQPMHPDFLRLHYPRYWHYDLLGGLVAMTEMGLAGDLRCAAALDLLEEKRLPDGGWPAEARFYSVSSEPKNGASAVDWGGTNRRRMNPWVTADALVVLARSGRL